MMIRKFSAGAVLPGAGLGARQIKVVASDASVDRDGDIMLPQGCDFSAYKKNPIVLAGHDRFRPIGTAAIARTPSAVEAVVTFAPPGVSATADEYCGLAKSGVVSAVSIGFNPIQGEPRANGRGVLWKAWELLEISLVAVGSNPSALVMERSYAKDGRVLAGVHADALMRAHRRISAARQDVADVLKAAGRLPAGEDPEADEPDEELAYEIARRKRAMRGRDQFAGFDPDAERRRRIVAAVKAGRPSVDTDADRRRRLVAVAKARLSPAVLAPSSSDRGRAARMRIVERLRKGP